MKMIDRKGQREKVTNRDSFKKVPRKRDIEKIIERERVAERKSYKE